MGVVGQLCCPGVLIFFGAVLLLQGTGGKKKIDKIQASLVDNSFIEGDDVQEETDSCSETGIVTCEQIQAEKFKNGTADKNGTDWSMSSTGGLDNDIYVFSVSNVEDVIAGEKPRLMTVGPFELKKQSPDKLIDSFTDGTVTYQSGTKYFFRGDESGAPDSSEQDLLDQEIVIPNAFYAILCANMGMEHTVLSQVAGMYYRMQPGASWELLKTMLQGAGGLTDEEIQTAYSGLLDATSQAAIGQTVMLIAGTWAPAKQMAVFGHIAEIASATAKAAYGTAYGTGVALPMFIKMTAAEFLGWDGATKPDPIGKVNVGLNLLKTSMPENKKGPTVVRTGEKYGAKFARYVVKDNGVSQRCNFDKDCMKQDKYKAAYAESKARDQCDAGVDHCDPLVVEGYQGGKTLPASLFGSEFGSDEHGEGSTVVLYIGGVGRVQLRNTGLKDWDGVKYFRWVLDKVLDRRENCNAEDAEGSAGIDCDSPLTTWTLAPWYSDPAPPIYASPLEFKIPVESMYASNGVSSPTDLKMGSVVLTEYAQTLTNTEGPYDPAEKVVFLSPLAVAPDIFIDSEPETGTIIRASKPMQVSMRMKNSLLFPDVGDVMIPVVVQYEYAAASEGARKTLKSLQKAGRQEVGTIVLLTGIGSMLVASGAFMCLFRMPGLLRKPKTEEGVVFC